eukprot:m.101489 g.101489  ORF g.101489 m.101489 type:complete len:370 (-) comp15173_c0_seq2:1119-2228(-)
MAGFKLVNLLVLAALVTFSCCQSIKESITCPDSQTTCSSNTTCCKRTDSTYGCCPFADGQCCTDNTHCCPGNYTCGENQQCFPPAAIVAPLASHICPDRHSVCPDGSTCCLLSGEYYGCCPFSNAVCCADHSHCCPADNTCDDTHHTCLAKSGLVTMAATPFPASLPVTEPKRTVPARPITTLSDVTCNDGSRCASGTTCCPAQGSGYGCCPIANAVCCSDNVHCCPDNLRCNLAAGGCTPPESDQLVLAFNQTAAPYPPANHFPKQSVVASSKPSPHSQAKVNCTSSDSSCPENTTCCQMEFGAIACCPLPNATCCATTLGRCCPDDYVCSANGTECQHKHNATLLVPSLASLRPFRRPDHETQVPLT